MIIALNNKCNLKKEDFLTYQKELETIEKSSKIILCPTNIFIGIANLSNIELGAQNVSSTECGAYTGEVSASQLKSMEVKYCIVGHSERRKYQQETNKEINEKVKNLLREEIIPILCIGESKEERENNQQNEVIINEIEKAISDLNEEIRKKIIIAYEPIWAIGTGKTATSADANNSIKAIRNKIKELYGEAISENISILYGGSVKSSNAKELFETSDIDGALIGGASLKLDEFEKIINYDK